MKSKPMHFPALLEAVFQRMVWLAAVRTAGNAILFTGIFGWAIVVLLPATSHPIAAIVAAVAGATVSLLMLAVHHPTRLIAATACDAAAGAAELFSTALLLQGKWQMADPAWRKSVLARANEEATRLDPTKVRIGTPRWGFMSFGSILLLALLLWPHETTPSGETTIQAHREEPALIPDAPLSPVAPAPQLRPTPGKTTANTPAPASEAGTKTDVVRAASESAGIRPGSESRGGVGSGEARSPGLAPASPAPLPKPAGEADTGIPGPLAGSAAGGAATRSSADTVTGGTRANPAATTAAHTVAGGHAADPADDPRPNTEVPAPYRDIVREYMER